MVDSLNAYEKKKSQIYVFPPEIAEYPEVDTVT